MIEFISIVGTAALVSFAVSVWTVKKAAAYYFEIADSYVEDVCDATIKSNKETLASVRKLIQGRERQ